MNPLRRRFLIEWMLMFMLLPSVMVWLTDRPGLLEINTAVSDRMLREWPPTPSQDVLIIGIDRRSMDALGPWPWSRTVHADFLRTLAPHSPRAILFDVYFDQPAPNAEDDLALAQAMAGLPVYLPLSYEAPHLNLPGGLPRLVPPIPILAMSARGVGHVNITPDHDGLVRMVYRWVGSPSAMYPYIGLQMLTSGNDGVLNAPEAPGPNPARGWGRFRVPFAGPAGTFRAVSYVDVLHGTVPDEFLRAKYVLVGALLSGALDDSVPVAGVGVHANLPGIEIHANALDALLQRRTVELAGGWQLVLWISLPIWIALVMFLRKPRHAAAVALLVTSACLCVMWAAITQLRIVLPLVSPLAGIALAYLLWSWRRLDALLIFLRERIDALVTVPAGPFEPPISHDPMPLDTVDRFTLALDHAIRRLSGLQSLLADGLWLMPVGVLVCDPDGVIRQSNAAARALLPRGHPPRGGRGVELERDPLMGIDLPALLATLPRSSVEPPDGEDAHAPWSHAQSGEYTTPEGRAFRLRAAPLSVTDDATRPGWVVVVRELTLERAAQREREQWFGFLSHDLRSPQVTILSLLELHRKGDQGVDAASLTHGIEREARRTIRLTENIMDMMEVESRTSLRLEETSIGTVVLDAIDSAWPYALSRGVMLVPRLGESDCMVWADAGLLTRALLNLLNNAIRHSPPETEIRICLAAAQDDQGTVLLSIRDEGEGMNAGQLNHVRSATGAGSGAQDAQRAGEVRRRGIGIAVVHAIIARHGGLIDATSAPGAGTTVLLSLPLSRACAESQDALLTAVHTS